MKWINAIACCTLFVTTISAQAPQQPNTPAAPAAASTQNVVAGLTLPASQTVNYDEGFVSLTAECKGTVKWLVLSTTARVKFKVNAETPNYIDVAVPPQEGSIAVFCVGIVDGKLTDIARTDITVRGPPDPTPPVTPPAPPVTPPVTPPAAGPLHLSIIEDPQNRTQAIRGILDNTALVAQLRAKNIIVRTYAMNDPVLATKNFTAIVQRYGAPTLILQDNTGRALVLGSLPATPAALLQQLTPFVPGGF